MGVTRVMDRSGDSRSVWSADNPDEVAAEKEKFRNLKAKGYRAFGVKENGKKGEPVSEFDSSLQALIYVPPMAGG